MIAINAKAAFGQPKTGLEEYTYQLLVHLVNEAQKRGLENYLLLYTPTLAHVPQDFLLAPVKIIQSRFMWTQARLAFQLILDRPDVFFNTEQILPQFAPRRSVITVHDLAYELFPEFYPTLHRQYLHLVTKHAVKSAKKIIAISERTKRDISKFYGIKQRNIEVVHHGFSRSYKDEQTDAHSELVTLPLRVKAPYILFVGRIEHKKNLITLIRAFERFCWLMKSEFHLFLVGTPGFGYEEIRRRALTSPLAKQIFFLGYVDDKTKSDLYHKASLFVFISLYEGFGLPILEAQRFGVPVVAANTSSLPEVVGGGGIFVDPNKPENIAEEMTKLVKHKAFRSRMIKEGYQNLKRFSWEKSAQQTLDILLSV